MLELSGRRNLLRIKQILSIIVAGLKVIERSTISPYESILLAVRLIITGALNQERGFVNVRTLNKEDPNTINIDAHITIPLIS